MNKLSIQFIEQFLGRFRYATKFIIVGLLSLSACLVLFASLYNSLNANIEFAEKELIGVEQINSLLILLDYSQQHRGVANKLLTGNAAAEVNLTKLDQEIDKQVAAIDAVLIADDQLGLSADWKNLKSFWLTMKPNVRAMNATESFVDHTDFVDIIKVMIVNAADKSNLTLDPELPSYFLMDVVTLKLPDFIELTAKLRGQGVKILNQKQITDKEYEQILIAAHEAKLALFNAQANLNKAVDAAKLPEADKLKSQMDALLKNNKRFIDLTKQQILQRQFTMSSEDYFLLGSEITTASYGLVAQSSEVLKQIIEVRMSQGRQSLLVDSIIALVVIVLITILYVVMARTTARSITQAGLVMGKMAAGDFSATMQVATKDEMGELAQKITQTNVAIGQAIVDANRVLTAAGNGNFDEHIEARYQGDLAKLSDGINSTIAQIADAQRQQAVEKQRAEQAATEARNLADEIGRKAEADRKVAEENYRIRMALDSVSTNAMIADADGIIIYCNSAVQNLMRMAEGDIRKQLPTFTAATLLGSNFDIFHRNPNHQRNLLGSLRNTHVTQISVGGLTFRLTANPIVNANGERLGTVLEWLDRTQEVAVEKEIEQVVSAAAAGDFSLSLRTDDKAGFFLLLSNNLNQLIEVTRNALSDIGNVLGNLAEGNLRVTMQRNYDGAFGQVQGDINRTISQLTETISGIRHAANSIAHGAREVDEGAQDLSSRTEEQAASLEETAASMEEMTQTIQQSADNARNASALVIGVQTRAQTGSVIVANAIESMDGIRIASKKIVDIVSIIDEISFQTNLLALNAAVEASRAGEHGRGFAVVASEVRNLAQHSSSAAKEIRGLINDSVDRIEEGVKLVSETGGNLNEIKTAVENASQMVENIALAVREQAVGIAEVNKAITRMEENTQQNAAMVEESSAAAANMNSQCEEMNELVGFFRV